MSDKTAVIEKICTAFEGNGYPGDGYLQGSFEGCEAYEEVSPFQGQMKWQGIDAAFLDGHATALSFFSEAGFRFFLPAYLIADLRGQLNTADPVFHLTHGFSDITVQVSTKSRVFVLSNRKSTFLNPRRYGAATFYDYAHYRLSVFTREEASAIVAYLTFRRDADLDGVDTARIEAALRLFWLERAQTAPVAESLKQHLAEQEAYLAAMDAEGKKRNGEL